MIIGLTGTNGAGKSTIAEILKSKGFTYNSLSDVLREESAKRGIRPTRDNLVVIGNELRMSQGNGVLAKKILEKVRSNKEKKAIVDSIRNPDEINELRKEKDFMLIAVDAPIETRFERVKARGRTGDKALTFDDFRYQDEREMVGESAAQQIRKCIEMADHLIVNDGAIEDLKKKIEEIL